MIGDVTLGTHDFERARAFYDLRDLDGNKLCFFTYENGGPQDS